MILVLIFIVVILVLVVLLFFFKNEEVHILKKYDVKTKQTTTLEYIIKDKDTIFQGKFICYNEKGNKTYEGVFVNGHIKGKTIHYYDNGNIESIDYIKNSKVTEESTYNYPSGKVMKYLMYDDFGILDFLIRYDESTNVKSYEGLPLIEIYQYKIANKEQFKIKINQYLKVGDTLKHQYFIANIPNAKRNFKIENLDVDNKKVKRTFKKTSQTGIDVKEILTKKGINTIRAIVKYEFNDKEKTVINDTISFKVMVD
ncbi:toxin-antitoxin system YwqK family antitoxin [Flavobacterium pectinovorum]|nr:hypothetical protein [Flavobacterium pectinovorum]